MGLCVLIGSKNDETQGHALEVLHYIEYLKFDLENQTVYITADFFVRNVTKKAASLYGLHRGNIRFTSETEGWFEDKEWTAVLLELAREEIGLTSTTDGKIFLCEVGGHTEQVKLLYGNLMPWGPEAPSDGSYVSFTAWKSPLINPGEFVLFRVSGSIFGESYTHLMPDPNSGDPIRIMGGMPLQQEINDNLMSSHEFRYRKFEENYLEHPAFSHIFFERIGGHSLRTIKVSSDMTKVCVNKPFHEGRFINWYWSDTDFNVYAQANGPVLEMIVE